MRGRVVTFCLSITITINFISKHFFDFLLLFRLTLLLLQLCCASACFETFDFLLKCVCVSVCLTCMCVCVCEWWVFCSIIASWFFLCLRFVYVLRVHPDSCRIILVCFSVGIWCMYVCMCLFLLLCYYFMDNIILRSLTCLFVFVYFFTTRVLVSLFWSDDSWYVMWVYISSLFFFAYVCVCVYF